MTTPPLEGIRIVEFAGIGPGPFAGMMLADLGADVIRLDRGDGRGPAPDPLLRSANPVPPEPNNPETHAPLPPSH